MSVTIEVKSDDGIVKVERERAAYRVLDEFGDQLPDLNLLAFFDDCDWESFKRNNGRDNRGLYAPLKPNTFVDWPAHVAKHLYVTDPTTLKSKRIFGHLIYLHGSGCADQTGMIMTFAHELQHFVQYGFSRKLWAENLLLPRLPLHAIEGTGLNWPDVPTECEARIIAKRIAVKLCGSEAVRRYIESRTAQSLDPKVIADWRFIQELDHAMPYDVASETRRIFQRLRLYRADLEDSLSKMRSDPDFQGLELSIYFDRDLTHSTKEDQ
jgi:hypothetical protein